MTQPQSTLMEPGGCPPDAVPPAKKRLRLRIPSWAGAALALIIVCAFTAHGNDNFLRASNFLNILENNSTVGMIAIGMTLVITMGGIDLSVGSLVALSGGLGILALNYVYHHQSHGAADAISPVVAGATVTIVAAGLCGLLNGLLIAKGRISPFIATLAGLLMFRSTAMWVARGGQFFSADSEGWFAQLGNGIPIPGTNISHNPRRVVPLEFPYSVIVWLVVALIAMIILNRTRLGRYIIAIGNNERAALYSAIAVNRIKIITYTLIGLVTGVAAFMNAANYISVNSANTGSLMELDAIAAVVIGGTRMEGGSGSIFGTVLGVLLLGVIRNMMVFEDISTYAQGVVTGAIIIGAVLLQRLGAKRA